MFIITPKTKHNCYAGPGLFGPPHQTPSSRPIAKIGRARALKACDRCRLKKVKCDGVAPCLRCQQDEVVCIITKREQLDPKAASRDYISSLEAQQKSLIEALQQIQRHEPQAIDSAGLRDILDTVQAHGYELQAPENPNRLEKYGQMEDSQPPTKRRWTEDVTPLSQSQIAAEHNITDQQLFDKRKIGFKEVSTAAPQLGPIVSSTEPSHTQPSLTTTPPIQSTGSWAPQAIVEQCPDHFDFLNLGNLSHVDFNNYSTRGSTLQSSLLPALQVPPDFTMWWDPTFIVAGDLAENQDSNQDVHPNTF